MSTNDLTDYERSIKKWILNKHTSGNTTLTVRNLYTKYYPSLVQDNEYKKTDETVISLLSIGVNKNIPLLLTLNDCYTRYIIINVHKP